MNPFIIEGSSSTKQIHNKESTLPEQEEIPMETVLCLCCHLVVSRGTPCFGALHKVLAGECGNVCQFLAGNLGDHAKLLQRIL